MGVWLIEMVVYLRYVRGWQFKSQELLVSIMHGLHNTRHHLLLFSQMTRALDFVQMFVEGSGGWGGVEGNTDKRCVHCGNVLVEQQQWYV